MRTKIIENPFIPSGGFTAITLFGFIFTRDRKLITPHVVNHERIHCRQQKELLYIPFFILYIIEWLVRLFIYRDRYEAYRNISFEREAYENDRHFGYLDKRRSFSWLRHF